MHRHALLFVMALAVSSGCANMNWKHPIPWKSNPDDITEDPRRVMAFWSESALHQANGPSLRGFGGRMVFFADDQAKPVKVAGRLVVYAFDEAKSTPPTATPAAPNNIDGTATRKFEFTAEELPKHFSEAKLGATYSFWLPWDESGGEQKEITLVPYFISASGKVVAGEPQKAVLQGKTPLVQSQPFERSTGSSGVTLPPVSGVRQINYETAVAGAATHDAANSTPTPRQLNSTTINLTPQLTRAMSAAPAASSANNQTVDPRTVYMMTTGGTTAPNLQPAAAAVVNSAPGATPQQPSTHSGRPGPQAPSSPSAPQAHGRGSWGQYRGGWQSDRRSQPPPQPVPLGSATDSASR
jgi:hypothetical protein